MLPAGVTAGVNLGIRSTNATTSRQQSLIAAKGVGDRVVFLVGNRTRNPDQVDVLHLMNQQMTQGMPLEQHDAQSGRASYGPT